MLVAFSLVANVVAPIGTIMGEALTKRGDCIGALDEYGLALARCPDYVAAHYNPGVFYGTLQQYAKAIEAYARGEAAPGARAGLVESGRGPLRAWRPANGGGGLWQGDRGTARLCVEAWENLVHTHRATGARPKGVAAYRELLRLRPEHAPRVESEDWIEGR